MTSMYVAKMARVRKQQQKRRKGDIERKRRHEYVFRYETPGCASHTYKPQTSSRQPYMHATPYIPRELLHHTQHLNNHSFVMIER